MNQMPGLIEPTNDRSKKAAAPEKRLKKDFWKTIKYGNRTEVVLN